MARVTLQTARKVEAMDVESSMAEREHNDER